jgi:nitroimidazol reductase NimA-like FMN-containing flavoprotein (pyridoxamine 5'-phosphate oxidase superfamily)
MMTDRRGDAAESPDEPTLEELSRAECWRALAECSIGRLGVITPDGLPYVVPVNYALDGETVVFQTDSGTKFDALLRHPVGFQVDEIDTTDRTGWTVLVQGIAHETTPHEVQHLGLVPWTGPKRHWVRIVPRNVSGRRIRLPDPRRPDDDSQ